MGNYRAIQMERSFTLLTWTKWTSAIYFHESSFEAAKALLVDCNDSVNQHICHASKNGVLLEKLRRQALQYSQQADIKRYLQHLHPGEDILVPMCKTCCESQLQWHDHEVFSCRLLYCCWYLVTSF